MLTTMEWVRSGTAGEFTGSRARLKVCKLPAIALGIAGSGQARWFRADRR